jgi:hypothetical protein
LIGKSHSPRWGNKEADSKAGLVLLATQETEIKRTKVQSQPRQIFPKSVSQKAHHQKGLAERLEV